MEKVKLNNGIEMPILGYGVYQVTPPCRSRGRMEPQNLWWTGRRVPASPIQSETVRRLVQIIREKLPEVYAAITQPKRDRQQPPQKQKPKSRDWER